MEVSELTYLYAEVVHSDIVSNNIKVFPCHILHVVIQILHQMEYNILMRIIHGLELQTNKILSFY